MRVRVRGACMMWTNFYFRMSVGMNWISRCENGFNHTTTIFMWIPKASWRRFTTDKNDDQCRHAHDSSNQGFNYQNYLARRECLNEHLHDLHTYQGIESGTRTKLWIWCFQFNFEQNNNRKITPRLIKHELKKWQPNGTRMCTNTYVQPDEILKFENKANKTVDSDW